MLSQVMLGEVAGVLTLPYHDGTTLRPKEWVNTMWCHLPMTLGLKSLYLWAIPVGSKLVSGDANIYSLFNESVLCTFACVFLV